MSIKPWLHVDILCCGDRRALTANKNLLMKRGIYTHSYFLPVTGRQMMQRRLTFTEACRQEWPAAHMYIYAPNERTCRGI